MSVKLTFNNKSYELVKYGKTIIDDNTEYHFKVNDKYIAGLIIIERIVEDSFLNYGIYKDGKFEFSHLTDTMEFTINDMSSFIKLLYLHKIIK